MLPKEFWYDQFWWYISVLLNVSVIHLARFARLLLLSQLLVDGIFHPLLRDLQTRDSSLHVWHCCLFLVHTNVLRLPFSFVFERFLSFC
jgi:hypothetical protein